MVLVYHDPPADIEPEPGALAHRLGSEERLEDALPDLRRHPGTGIAELHEHVVSVKPGPHGQRPGLAHRGDRVVDQVRPHLVQLARVGGDPGQPDSVVLDHADARRELTGQHQQRAVQQFVQVDDLVRGPVHLRVLLGRADQGGDPVGGVLDLVHQQFGLDGVVQPPHRALERRGVDRRLDVIEPGHVEPGRHEGRRELPAVGHAVILEPVADGVLPVRGLERLEHRRLRHPLGYLFLQPDHGLQAVPVVLRRGDHAQLVPHPGDALAQRGRGTDRGRGRVVQLMGQPGRQRAEREQPLALADRRLGVLLAEEQPLKQVHRHREPGVHQLGEDAGVQHEELRRLGHPHRVVVDLRHRVAEVGLEGTRVHAALRRPADLHVVGAHPARQDQAALQQCVEAGGGGALGVDRTRLDQLDVPSLAEPGELVVGELLEKEKGAQLVDAAFHLGCRGFGHLFSRYLCTSMTASAPSPTAEATRLAESERASPATNTPGTLVSR